MTWNTWRNEVVALVRFRPDRKAIAKELDAHYEDHVGNLVRIGYERDLAEERALRAMGDATEVGKAMDRAHKPWLGWLWVFSRGLLILACLLLLWSAFQYRFRTVDELFTPQLPEERWVGDGIALPCPAPFQMGAYEIEFYEAMAWRRASETSLRLRFSATTAKFWLEGPSLGPCVDVEDDLGTEYTYRGHGTGPGWRWADEVNDRHVQNDVEINIGGIPNDAEWVDIFHTTAGWRFRVELPAGEEGAA